VLAETAPEVAVIVVDPTPVPLNSPGVPVALATAGLLLFHVTVPPNGADVPSENSWVAAKVTVCPVWSVAAAGVTTVAVSTFATMVTLYAVEFVTAPHFAAIVTAPGATPVSRPLTIVASAAGDGVNVVTPVTSSIVPSEYFPVAVSCCV